MKTRITTLIIVLTLASLSIFAQNEHLKFKGIPIDGTLKEFTSKLIAKGYVLSTSDDNIISLTGSFAGYNDCTIIAYSLGNIDLVYSVVVMFPYYNSWSLLEGNYNNLKSMLTTKYGNPLFSDEYFNTEYPPSDDGSKIRQLMLDRCNYSTSFSTDNGYIILKITHESYKCYVLLGYLDKINNAYKEEEAIDDL